MSDTSTHIHAASGNGQHSTRYRPVRQCGRDACHVGHPGSLAVLASWRLTRQGTEHHSVSGVECERGQSVSFAWSCRCCALIGQDTANLKALGMKTLVQALRHFVDRCILRGPWPKRFKYEKHGQTANGASITFYGLRCFFDFRAYTSNAKSIWGFCEITASQTPKFGKWYYLAVQEQHRGLY